MITNSFLGSGIKIYGKQGFKKMIKASDPKEVMTYTTAG